MSTNNIQRGDIVFYPASSEIEAVVVGGPHRYGSTSYWELRLPNGEDTLAPEGDLGIKMVDIASPISWLTDHPLSDPDSLARALTHLKLTSNLTDLVYSLGATRTLFRVHQFKPVLKIINSSRQRLLLADEVGLGKTIEAGLIWAELDARTPTRRVLVLCPSGLQYKWQTEMERRFDREMQIVGRSDFLKFVERYSERGDAARFEGICSFGALRSDDVLEALSSAPPSFDLVIVDEAHALRNPSTKTHHLGELVSSTSNAVLFLSATPVNLGSQDLFNLLKLLRPEEFSRPDLFEVQLEPNRFINEAARILAYGGQPTESLNELEKVLTTPMGSGFKRNPVYNQVVEELARHSDLDAGTRVTLEQDIRSLNTISETYVRTRRRDLPDDITLRKAKTVVVQLSPLERQIHDLSVEIATDLARSSSGVPAGFARIMPARQASSCLPVMAPYLRGVMERRLVTADLEEGLEEALDGVAVRDTTEVELPHVSIETKISEAITEAESLGDVDSKFDFFVREIELLRSEGANQMLVFSFFRRTLAYLESRLESLGYRTGLMTGATPLFDRNRLADDFRKGDFEILLSSEIGAEGLDFEFCDVVVNYDLPWNPMRLEQRIGRLDRFGQQNEVIHIINFEIAGTIDSDIFLRLYDRIGVFESSIGELEPILGERFVELTRDLASFSLTPQELDDRVLQLSLAVERERQELEVFEEERARLVGADAHVELAVAEAQTSGRYLTPQEIRRYLEGFFRDFIPDAKVAEDNDGGLLLSSSPELGEFLRSSTDGPVDDQMALLVQRLETGNSLPIAFSGDDAYGSDSEFLNVRHPLLRAIAGAYEREAKLHPSGFVEMEMDSDKGDWIFFIVKYDISALDVQRRLQVFAWSPERNEISLSVGREIMSQLSGAKPKQMRREDIPVLDRTLAAEAYERITGEIDSERARIQFEVESRNTAHIESQIQSLTLGYQSKEEAILTQLRDKPDLDERIKRMREGELRNAQARYKQQLAVLEDRRVVSVGLKPVASGLARIT